MMRIFLFSLGILLLGTAPAHAYLDPGTASILLQAIIGGVVMVGVTAKLYWSKIVNLFRPSIKQENRKDAGPAGTSERE